MGGEPRYGVALSPNVMKTTPSPRAVRRHGMTLLELTVVIATLLSLLSVTFIGARAWKRGSDRSMCLMNLRNVQVAVRSYQNLYGYNEGGRPYADGGTQDIGRHLLDKGYIGAGLYRQTQGLATCPGGGVYSRAHPDIFPLAGTLYMECSLAETNDHKPADTSSW